MTGRTTLLGVISMAKGETDVATLKQVVVFRTVNGQRMGAVFDVASIRRGQADHPVMQGNDMVVVGSSAAKKFWKDVVTAAPVFNIFSPRDLQRALRRSTVADMRFDGLTLARNLADGLSI